MTQYTKDPRGGKRSGAGRKRLDHPRIFFGTRIAPETLKAIDKEAKENKTSRGRVLDNKFSK